MKLSTYKTLMKLLENSLGSKLRRNFYFIDENGEERDILENGELSCAIFASTILYLVKLIERPRFRVESVMESMENAGRYEINELKPGAVIIRETFEGHLHIGFCIDKEHAISHSYNAKSPIIHEINYQNRKIEKIFWHDKLNIKN